MLAAAGLPVCEVTVWETPTVVGHGPGMNRFPVVEVFGPTIQGEGELAGVPTAFVRFGGCDYRCTWCDSLHAVLPEDVREAPRMTATRCGDAAGSRAAP